MIELINLFDESDKLEKDIIDKMKDLDYDL